MLLILEIKIRNHAFMNRLTFASIFFHFRCFHQYIFKNPVQYKVWNILVVSIFIHLIVFWPIYLKEKEREREGGGAQQIHKTQHSDACSVCSCQYLAHSPAHLRNRVCVTWVRSHWKTTLTGRGTMELPGLPALDQRKTTPLAAVRACARSCVCVWAIRKGNRWLYGCMYVDTSPSVWVHLFFEICTALVFYVSSVLFSWFVCVCVCVCVCVSNLLFVLVVCVCSALCPWFLCQFSALFYLLVSISSSFLDSPWYDLRGWLGVKSQISIFLSILFFVSILYSTLVCSCQFGTLSWFLCFSNLPNTTLWGV